MMSEEQKEMLVTWIMPWRKLQKVDFGSNCQLEIRDNTNNDATCWFQTPEFLASSLVFQTPHCVDERVKC